MGLAEKIPGIRRLVRNRERSTAEEAPVATQFIISSGGRTLDLGPFIGEAARALEASTGDGALRTLYEMIRNPVAAASVIGGGEEDLARAGSVLLYQATKGQVVTETLKEMIEEATRRQEEVIEAQNKARRYQGVRGSFRRIFDGLDPFVEPDGW